MIWRFHVDSLKIELTEEDIKYLEEPYKPVGVVGHQWTSGLLALENDLCIIRPKRFDVYG